MQHNVLAMSGKAVEAAGDVNSLLLDKTGTITLGNRQAVEFLPVDGVLDRRTGRCRATLQPGRRDARRPLGRGAGKREVRSARAPHSRARSDLHSLFRLHADERRRFRRTAITQGRHGRDLQVRRRARRPGPRASFQEMSDRIARNGGTPLAVCRRQPAARDHPPEGHREGRDEGADRAAAPHGHSQRDDHRRQSAHRGRHRRPKPAWTISWLRRRPRTSWSTSRRSRPPAAWSR